MSGEKKKFNPMRFVFEMSQADAGYLFSLIGADIVALRARPEPRSKNVLLLRAYSIRERLNQAVHDQSEKKAGMNKCAECNHDAHPGSVCCELLTGHGYNTDSVCQCYVSAADQELPARTNSGKPGSLESLKGTKQCQQQQQ